MQRGRGRGEALEPLPAPARELDLVLVLPGFGCPTPEVYRALAPFLPGPEGPRQPAALLAALHAGNADAVGRALWNRLELPAFARWPRLRELRDLLRARPGVTGALLSGSGSTLLAVCADAASATRLASALAREELAAVATRTAWGAPA